MKDIHKECNSFVLGAGVVQFELSCLTIHSEELLNLFPEPGGKLSVESFFKNCPILSGFRLESKAHLGKGLRASHVVSGFRSTSDGNLFVHSNSSN